MFSVSEEIHSLISIRQSPQGFVLESFLELQIDTVQWNERVVEYERVCLTMGLFAYLLLIYVISCCPFLVEGIVKNVSNEVCSPAPKSSVSRARIFKSSMENFVDKLFYETDTNEDGMISLEEAYVGCLLLYVRLNRRAPIPPPSREKFRRIFLKNVEAKEVAALNKEEYGDVLKRITARALLRLTSYRVVTFLGAPLLTEMIVRSLACRKESFEKMLRYILPINLHDTLIPTLTSKAFHRGFWLVVMVVTLGNICLAAVTFLLDLGLPKAQSMVDCVTTRGAQLTKKYRN